MHELTYRSTAQPNLSPIDLQNILNTSIANNERLHITGCLIYHKGKFVQTLQGAKKHIFELYKEIEKDNRHHLVELIWEGPSDKVVFDGWHMAYYSPSERTNAIALKEFEINLLILSSMHNEDSVSVRLFWSHVKSLLI